MEGAAVGALKSGVFFTGFCRENKELLTKEKDM